MFEAEVLGKHIIVEGFRNARVKDVDKFFDLVRKETEDCHVQFFDAKMIAGFSHLYFAALNALKAFEAKLNISRNLAVEVLLFASGQHQIRKAVELIGIKPDSSEVIALILADTRQKAVRALNSISNILGGERCGKVVELTDEKVKIIRKAFGIGDLEIEATLRESEKEALVNLLIEHCSLLVTQR